METPNRIEMLKYIPSGIKTLLDVGCGFGAFSSLIKKERNCEVWGTDITDKLPRDKVLIDKFIQGDIASTIDQLPDSYFDCIVFNDVLEHLYDPETILLKMKSKLKSKGIIVCSIPNVRFVHNLKNLLLKKEWKYEDDGILDRTHIRFFTIKSIREMFHKLDYQIIRIEGLKPAKSALMPLLNILSFKYFDDIRYLQFACVVKPK